MKALICLHLNLVNFTVLIYTWKSLNFHFVLIIADGILLKEVDRLLRPNGYFVYSAPPAYRKDKEYPMIWEKLVNLTTAMCWKLIARKVQTAIWIKQENPACLIINAENKAVEICDAVDDFQPSWKIPLRNCIQVADQSYAQKLPPRPERLSVYSRSLRKIGIPFLSKEILLVVFGSSIHQALIAGIISRWLICAFPECFSFE